MLGAHDRLTDLAVKTDTLFIEHPRLRKYFYSGADFTELAGDDLHQLLAMAELMSDFMENAIQHESFDSVKVVGEWRDYCYALMRDSPAIRVYLHENQHWYSSEIGDMLRKVESSFHHPELIALGGFEVTILTSAAGDEPLRAQLERIYNSSFPPEERENPDYIFDSSPDREVFVLRDPHDHSALGFASVLRVDDSIELLEYLAVSPNQRNSGIGGYLLEFVFDSLSRDGSRTLFMELEKPESAGASHQAARRIRFYERHGCKPVEWVPDYWIPNFRIPGQRVPMHLYCKQFHPASPSPDPGAFQSLYRRAYPQARPEDTPIVVA